MSRPSFSARGKATNSSNPFIRWKEERKERQMQAEDEAAKLITNKAAGNQSALIRQLDTIDFIHSRLPKSVLESKLNPAHSCGELEYCVKAFINALKGQTEVIKMDIRELDVKLMTLVNLLKQAVDLGDVKAAYIAKAGLYKGIIEIRLRTLQNQPELAKAFVEANAVYLDEWIQLVNHAKDFDNIKRGVDIREKEYNKAIESDKESQREIGKQIREDAERADAFSRLNSRGFTQDRTKWTPLESEVYGICLKAKLDGISLELNKFLLENAKAQLIQKESIVNALEAKIRTVPNVSDPDAMNKFKESMDRMTRQLAEQDQEIHETIGFMDELHGRIVQHGHGPGAQRAMEAACEGAAGIIEKIQNEEKNRIGKRKQDGKKILEELGLHNEEELAQLQKQREEEDRLWLQEMIEQMNETEEVEYEDDDEEDLLTN